MSDLASEAPNQRALIALIPPFVGAVVAYLLRGAGEFAQLGGSLVAVLVTGAPLYQRALRGDKKRSAPVQNPQNLSAPTQTAIDAGPLTIALSIVLGAAAFWLIDLLLSLAVSPLFTTINSYQSLEDYYYYYDADVQSEYIRSSLVSTPLLLAAAFPIAVWLAHRSRDRAYPTLTKAVVLYTVMALATNVVIADTLGATIKPWDIFIPLIVGLLVWAMASFACVYARHTQYRYDAMRTARPGG